MARIAVHPVDGVRKTSDGVKSVRWCQVVVIRNVLDCAKKVSDCARKVSDCARKVSDGVGKVSDGIKKMSDGARKVSDGVRKCPEYILKDSSHAQSIFNRPGVAGAVLKTASSFIH